MDEGDGTFVFAGHASIDELVERLDVDIEREGFETVGGFLLSHAGRVPVAGESFEIAGLQLQVLEAQRRRVSRVRVRKQPQPAEQGTS